MDLENTHMLGSLRNTLVTLIVCGTNIKTVSQILQCDVLHKSTVENNQVKSNTFHSIIKYLMLTDLE